MPSPPTHDEMLTIEGAVKHFPITTGLTHRQIGAVRAVDDVSFSVGRRETVGLVGESGCGKSTLARLIVRLEQADHGTARFEGADLFSASGGKLRRLRRGVQMVFQDPYSSLNPRASIGEAIMRAWQANPDVLPRSRWRERTIELLELVGLPAQRIDAFPHQLSGGQRQRVAVARALALNPRLIVCDEPVSALDVSVQAQVLHLLGSLQENYDVSYLFISHDLGVVRRVAHRVLVMYLGRIVESGPSEEVFAQPAHPYTEALLAAVPSIDPKRRGLETRALLQGDPPSPANPPSGCRFRTRCPRAEARCTAEEPSLEPIGTTGARVACHFPTFHGRQPLSAARADLP